MEVEARGKTFQQKTAADHLAAVVYVRFYSTSDGAL